MLILIFAFWWGGERGQIGDKKPPSQETLKSLWDLSREARFKRVEIRAVERRQLLCVAPVCVAG